LFRFRPRVLIQLLLLGTILFFLNGCFGGMDTGQASPNFKEQQYIDARLNFSIKHPLAWQRIQVPVSSIDFRPDTIIWRIQDPENNYPESGEMLIRATPATSGRKLADVLNAYLDDLQLPGVRLIKPFAHPAGKSLISEGYDEDQGWMVLALQGQHQDFIISIDFPARNFSHLLPVFLDIVGSFVELGPPAPEQN